MIRWVGRYLFGVGTLHSLGVLHRYPDELDAIVRSGIYDSVSHSIGHQAAFWFLMTGLCLMVLASVIDLDEKHDRVTPLRVGASLAALTVIGLAAMPFSPFWLLVPPVTALFWRTAKSGRQ